MSPPDVLLDLLPIGAGALSGGFHARGAGPLSTRFCGRHAGCVRLSRQSPKPATRRACAMSTGVTVVFNPAIRRARFAPRQAFIVPVRT